MSTIAELQALATQIRNETNPGANTALRNGNMLLDIIDTFAALTTTPITLQQVPSYISNRISGQTAQAVQLQPGTLYLYPIFIPVSILLAELHMYIRVSAATDGIAGVYSSVNGLPGLLISGTGDVWDGTVFAQWQEFDFPDQVIINPGWYYIALSPESANVNFNGSPTGIGYPLSFIRLSSTDTNATMAGSITTALSSFALPADLTAATLDTSTQVIELVLSTT